MVIHSGFTLFWELYHPSSRTVLWVRTAVKVCNAAMSVFYTMAPVMLFAVFGELLVVYHRKIKSNLQHFLNASMTETNFKNDNLVFVNITFLLKEFPNLNCVSQALIERLGFPIIITWISSFISIINICYYLVYSRRHIQATIWNCLQIIHHVAKLLLMCLTVDRIRNSVTTK